VELNESTITAIVRRVYDSVQSVSEERPSPGTRATINNASVEDEMSQRFSLPRRGQLGLLGQEQRPQQGNRPSFYNSRPRYNPQVNYGHSSVAKGKGKGKSGKSKGKETVLNRKELILLPSPTYTQVPRFENKRKLQELGLIIDGFPFDKSWDDYQLRLKVIFYFVILRMKLSLSPCWMTLTKDFACLQCKYYLTWRKS
jgi:hypothetical protein